MTALPDRILVYGVTGSGKSTAALAIGGRTGLPVTFVDELTWLPGWVPVEDTVQPRRTVSGAATKEPRCNGNVESWRNMLSRDSILLWHCKSFARKRGRMRAWAADPELLPPVLLFRRPRELEAWLECLDPAD